MHCFLFVCYIVIFSRLYAAQKRTLPCFLARYEYAFKAVHTSTPNVPLIGVYGYHDSKSYHRTPRKLGTIHRPAKTHV